MRPVLAILLVLGATQTATAQTHDHWADHACTLYDIGGAAWAGPALDPVALAAEARRSGGTVETAITRGRAATFIVEYSGFTDEARAAFQQAVDIWADHLTSAVPVRVQASFGPLGERVLGAAGPRLVANFPMARRPDTWYPFALADALAGFDLFPPQAADDPATPLDESFSADIFATFSSTNEDFYFGTDGQPAADQFDFVTIVLHELGHGLGFVGSGDVDDGVVDPDATPPNGVECTGTDGIGCYGAQTGGETPRLFPYIFDRFVEDRDGVALLNGSVYPQNSRPLGDLLQSEDLFVNAPTVVRVNEGERPPVWAPADFEAGSSYSHWDEVIFSRGTPAALMTPRIARGEAYLNPGSVTCAFFSDMGWPLGDGCSLLVGPEPEPPEPGTFELVATGPNPFLTRTTFGLEVGTRQRVEARLYDTAGRWVADLFSGTVAPGIVPIRIDGSRLAAAAYVLVVEGETTRRSILVVHLG